VRPDDHFDDFVASAEEAFGRDPTDAALVGIGFIELLHEPLAESHVKSALFATFLAHGRRLGRTSALFRLMARPYAAAFGFEGEGAVLGLTLRVEDGVAMVAVPADTSDSHVIVDLGAGGVVYAAGADLVRTQATSLDPELVAVVEVDAGRARMLPALDDADQVRESALSIGCLAAAMEILGASEAMLTLGVDHARSREQFGLPIASFQAVRHLLALSWLDVQALRHLCLATLRGIGSSETRLAEVTKAVAGRNGRRTADRTQQVLGAIGFTWEHPHHRLYRRVLVLDSLLVRADVVMTELARGAADGIDPTILLPLIVPTDLATSTSTSSA
jgi:hypothetical protein